jgi:hypothetical protein
LPFKCNLQRYIADAPVCSDARCPIGNYSTPECRPAVIDHCFYNASDPGCNVFRPIPPPAEYCPKGLAFEYCAEKPTDPDCAELHAPRPACGFAAAPGIGDNASSPCKDPACADGAGAAGAGAAGAAGGLYSAECRLVIGAYCEKNPTDRECELHGLGDGCMFLPGSAPCEVDACTSGGESSPACKAVVASYCLGKRAVPDPQCSLLGYAPALQSSTPVDEAPCPWAAAYKRCEGDQLAKRAACLQMYMGGLISRAQVGLYKLNLSFFLQLLKLSRELNSWFHILLLQIHNLCRYAQDAAAMPGTAALAATAAAEKTAALAAFIAAGTARDAGRSDAVARTALYASLWRDAEANGDAYLSASVGGCTRCIPFTHSLKAPGVKALNL